MILIVFFFNDTATTEIYTYLHTLSLHDALQSCEDRIGRHRQLVSGIEDQPVAAGQQHVLRPQPRRDPHPHEGGRALPIILRRITVLEEIADRKSTRLNSSH